MADDEGGADDLTGAGHLTLVPCGEGMRSVEAIGVPPPDFDLSYIEAMIGL